MERTFADRNPLFARFIIIPPLGITSSPTPFHTVLSSTTKHLSHYRDDVNGCEVEGEDEKVLYVA